ELPTDIAQRRQVTDELLILLSPRVLELILEISQLISQRDLLLDRLRLRQACLSDVVELLQYRSIVERPRSTPRLGLRQLKLWGDRDGCGRQLLPDVREGIEQLDPLPQVSRRRESASQDRLLRT